MERQAVDIVRYLSAPRLRACVGEAKHFGRAHGAARDGRGLYPDDQTG